MIHSLICMAYRQEWDWRISPFMIGFEAASFMSFSILLMGHMLKWHLRGNRVDRQSGS